MIDVPELVKDALRSGNYEKDYIIEAYKGGELIDIIDTGRIIAESVTIDEKLSSEPKLKFGLCEGSRLEFEYFDGYNILGARLRVLLGVEYINEWGEKDSHLIKMGWYDCVECSRQASTGIYKVICYNKLMSDYLDQNARLFIEDFSDLPDSNYVTAYGVANALLKEYGIDERAYETIERYKYTLHEEYNIPVSGQPTRTIRTYFSIYDCPDDKRITFYIDQFASELRSFYESMRPYLINDTASESAVLNSEAMRRATSIQVTFKNGTSKYYSVAYGEVSGVENIYKLTSLVDVEHITTRVPFSAGTSVLYQWTNPYIHKTAWGEITNEVYKVFDMATVKSSTDSEIDRALIDKRKITDVTLRQIQSSIFEVGCQFGQLDREEDMFYGLELDTGGLTPKNGLFPHELLFPSGNSTRIKRSEYSQLWTDTVGEQSFRNLIVKYKTLDENNNEIEAEVTKTVNYGGTTDYDLTDNWLFNNCVWSPEQIGIITNQMIAKMRNIKWFPFEMWSVGLPYLETGDCLEIALEDKTYRSYILQRTLKGVRSLADTFANGTLNVF